ncbi:hypothetical protein [Chitinimonas lacunae]|uniref:Cation transporter n=1 Tax=Chitinimonas lacunae TaxID=1963018 RepID=A0ABV8MIA6_9NEIS
MAPDRLDSCCHAIVFHPEPPQQALRAAELLADLADIEVQLDAEHRRVEVCYRLDRHCLAELESYLDQRGFRLDASLPGRLRRVLAHYAESLQQDNLRLPSTASRSREVFVRVYQHHAHGDADETPQEWRHYR